MTPEDAARIRALTDVSRETLSRLEQFVTLFGKWSRAINLAAPSTLPAVWERHVLDSVQLYALRPGPWRWVDLGSGGGFPGVVMAILLAETDGGQVALVESNHKKAAFLRQAIAETGAAGTVHAIRIEDAATTLPACDAVCARALASLDGLLTYARPWLCSGASGYFHKGRDYRREIDDARRRHQFDLIEHKSAVDADSVILQVDNVAYG